MECLTFASYCFPDFERPSFSPTKPAEIPVTRAKESPGSIAEECIKHCTAKGIENPVEILRYAQGCIVTCRKLDVQNFTDSIEGDTNYILINRHDVLGTAIEEIKATENPRLALEISFY